MRINLAQGDCLELMKRIPDNFVDMVLTDPPYGTTACKWDTVINFESMWVQLKRITKDNGAICLFGCEPFSSALRMANIKMFKYDWIWRKTEPSGHLNAKKRPLRTCEIVSIFYKKPPNYFPIKTSGHRKKTVTNVLRSQISTVYGKESGKCNYSSTERYPTEVLDFSRKRQKNKLHPTQKPVALLEYLIKTYTLEGETVLDFTMGSGSTGVACKNLKRNFLGIELDENYFNIAKKRIEEA